MFLNIVINKESYLPIEKNTFRNEFILQITFIVSYITKANISKLFFNFSLCALSSTFSNICFPVHNFENDWHVGSEKKILNSY